MYAFAHGLTPQKVQGTIEIQAPVGQVWEKVKNFPDIARWHPFSFYSAILKISPTDQDTSLVEWKSRFYRGDTGNFPPEHLNDQAAVNAMNDFLKIGLNHLKKILEVPR